MGLVFALFFVLPLALVLMVSFWDYNDYEIVPSLTLRSYTETFEGCYDQLPGLCTILKTYWTTAELCFAVWAITLVIGFTISYFLAFHIRSLTMQIVLALLCTIPFWTSNVIRMISWIPLLGRNGLVNRALVGTGVANAPVEWLLYSRFSVILAFVHLFTFFMVIPIFNSMVRIDKRLIEAAYDAGATGWQTMWNVVVPLCKPGIVIGSIFVVTIVMGDFVTVGVMGGEQIASAGKIIETRLNALQFPPAAANAVILLAATLLIITAPHQGGRHPQGALTMREGRSIAFYLLAAFFSLYVLFLYGPMIVIFVLSFQGPQGGMTFPMNGVSTLWFSKLWEGGGIVDIGAAFWRSLELGLVVTLLTVVFSTLAGLAYRRKFRGQALLFYVAIASLIVPSIVTLARHRAAVPPHRYGRERRDRTG